MSEPRLKAKLLVQAILRRYDIALIPAYLRRGGDPDAGAVLVKISLGRGPDAPAIVLTQARDMEGRARWLKRGGDAPLTDEAAEAMIAQALQRDPDLYVIEIEDAQGRILLDAPLL